MGIEETAAFISSAIISSNAILLLMLLPAATFVISSMLLGSTLPLAPACPIRTERRKSSIAAGARGAGPESDALPTTTIRNGAATTAVPMFKITTFGHHSQFISNFEGGSGEEPRTHEKKRR
ncbi:hypothetical protein FRC14_005369 [Serendipita sp. 396]|nr:hypothetical protein FRC14_005369 [Serendipita sp. 396]